jgi:hypothetical protein
MTPPASAARARPAVAPAPLQRPALPRRVSGPVRRPAAPRNSPSPLVRLLDSPFLDRLIRGRVWIGLVAFALLGIVAMQVAILRLGASIGASTTRIAQLEQSNQSAETTIARAEPGGDVGSEAAALGMVYPPAGNIVYLHYAAGEAAVAAHSYSAPTAPLFTSAAASLTAPLDPASSVDPGTDTTTPSTTTTTTLATTTTTAGTTTDATTPSSTTTTAPPATGGGAATVPADTTTGQSSLGAGGGSTAPSSGATG